MNNPAKRFDPEKTAAFHFTNWSFDATTSTAALSYALGTGNYGTSSTDTALRFTEEIVFHGAPILAAERRPALDRCLDLLHQVAGISYYKTALPPEIHFDHALPSPRRARFLETLYLHGLGELAYRNGIDLRGRIRVPSSAPPNAPCPLDERFELARRTAVPIGGGKDSVVTLEALRAAGEPLILLSVGDPAPIRDVSAVSGAPRIVIERRLAPELLELNRRGAINGHVPISAILAAVFAVAAVLYDFDTVAMSNERSADSGNLLWDGFEVNHQYSKSSSFEREFQSLLHAEVLPALTYFSFLRPFSELAITSLFSRADPAYRPVFRSCNTAFRLDPARRGTRWCSDCPKCRFVFLALAPFLPKAEMEAIFGANLLDDPRQEEGFAALLGLGEHKPFECVGEVRECAAALVLLHRDPAWRGDAVTARLVERVVPQLKDVDTLLREVFSPDDVERLPDRFRAMLPEVPAIPDASPTPGAPRDAHD